MKTLKRLPLIIGCILLSFQFSQAQSLSKAEKKALKKEIKKLMSNPAKYKKMKEDLNILRNEGSTNDRTVSALKNQVSQLKGDLSDRETKMDALAKKYEELSKTVMGDGKDITAGSDDYTKGIVFKVQVGAFTDKSYEGKMDGNFWEEDADGMKKYTIGYFRDYLEAKKFKEYLREIGVSDAWIVTYKDNQRKDIKNVLDKN